MRTKKILTAAIAMVVILTVVMSSALAYSNWPKHSWSGNMPTRRASTGTGPAPVYNDVKAIQSILAWQGYANLAIDGKFGTATRAAVMDFQADHSLDDDGVVGANTWNALQNQLVQMPNMPTAPGYCDYSVNGAGNSTRRFYHIYTGTWRLVSPSVCILS